MGTFFVKCALTIALTQNSYVTGQYLGVLVQKSADQYTVDFSKVLKKLYGSKAAPFIKQVPSNSCLFIGGPYGASN